MKNSVIIFGTSGIAKAALEIFYSNDIMVYGFLDDNKSTHGTEIDNVAVLGSTNSADYVDLIGEKCSAFIATDDLKLRKGLAQFLKEERKAMPMNAFHQSAIIPQSFAVGHGNFINAGATLGASGKMGHHNLIHSGAIIEHSAIIGNHVQIGAGSIVNPEVEIEDEVFIGSGVTLVAGIKVGKGAKIGAGSVVVENVAAGKTVFGNPAIEIK
ncbi:MAG: NeuD/PglB/VioB family sugar acetyltransferase [Bacteroidota bacterium]